MPRKLMVSGALAAVACALAAAATWGGGPPGKRAAALRDEVVSSGPEADASRGGRLFGQCAGCHSIGARSVDLDGPNLFGVVGAKVAARRPRYNYSSALRHAGGTWTVPRLDAWLAGPAAFAPGTTMGFAGLPEARDRADVIAYLATQGPTP